MIKIGDMTMKKILALLIALVLVFSLVSCTKPVPVASAAELLSLGEKYLLELDYEQAIVQFLGVIEIEPMNVRAYLGAAEAYIGLGRTDDAIAILQQGFDATGDAEIAAKLAELTEPEPTPTATYIPEATPTKEPTIEPATELTPPEEPTTKPTAEETIATPTSAPATETASTPVPTDAISPPVATPVATPDVVPTPSEALEARIELPT
ncbi:hypothetical protein FACS18949_10370 [Clostridia bacterium]|nr:hypothetical protein FACS18949_10370 [Clostridia bacterium]